MVDNIVVRLASSEDAENLSLILCTSIRSGCVLDHENRPDVVSAWTRNKSSSSVSRWLQHDFLYLVVATLNAKPVGVGMATEAGEIDLCYVLPEYFGRNIGKAIMMALEKRLLEAGFDCATLNSTITGYSFYKKLGYVDNGERFSLMGLTATPMIKRIVPEEFLSFAE